MTGSLPTTAAGCAGLLCLSLFETAEVAGPWPVVAVLTVLGIIGTIVKMLLTSQQENLEKSNARQDAMHAENREREKERFELEKERAKDLAAQTVLLASCAEELKELNQRMQTMREDIAAVPDRVTARMAEGGFQRRATT